MKQLVRDLMTTEVASLKQNESLSIANDVMSLGRIRHLPVLDDDGKLCGMVTQRDLIFNALARSLGFGSYAKEKALNSLRVQEVMTSDVISTTPDTLLADAAKLMLQKKLGCLPVLEDEHLVGILTEADFVAAFV